MAASLGEMIEIGDVLLARGWKAFEEVPSVLRERKHHLTNGDKILSAFLMKMLSTFEALVDDVRSGRGESMHHLKTLIESFIYLVDAASSEARASTVLGHAYNHQRRYLEANDSADNREKLRRIKMKGDALRPGQKYESETIEDIAKRHTNLPSWYDAVYRLACQPAHIGDLEDFFPTDDGVFPESAGSGRSVDAIRYGLEIMMWLVSFVNQSNVIGLVINVRRYCEAKPGS